MTDRFLRSVPDDLGPVPDVRYQQDLLAYLEAGPIQAPDQVVEGARAAVVRTRQRSWLRWVHGGASASMALAATAAIVVFALLAVAPLMLKSDEEVGTTPSPIPWPSERSVPAVRNVGLPVGVEQVLAGDGMLWAVMPDGNIRRLSTTSREPELSFALPVVAARTVLYGGGWLWVTGDEHVSRIDPGDGRRAEVTQPLSGALATADRAYLWISGWWDHNVTRVDARTMDAQRIPLAPPVGALDSTADGAWGVTRTWDIVRIDAESLDFDEAPLLGDESPFGPGRPALPDGPPIVLAVPGAVWVAAAGSDTVVKVDPMSLEITGALWLPQGYTIDRLLDIGGEAWILSGARLLHLDSATSQVDDIVVLGSQPEFVETDGSAVWVVSGGRAELVEP